MVSDQKSAEPFEKPSRALGPVSRSRQFSLWVDPMRCDSLSVPTSWVSLWGSLKLVVFRCGVPPSPSRGCAPRRDSGHI